MFSLQGERPARTVSGAHLGGRPGLQRGALQWHLYYPHPKTSFYLHFDSWRLNMRPGTWLPAYVYSEETNMKTTMGRTLHFRGAQTRLWGYDLKALNKNAEFTQILVDSVSPSR